MKWQRSCVDICCSTQNVRSPLQFHTGTPDFQDFGIFRKAGIKKQGKSVTFGSQGTAAACHQTRQIVRLNVWSGT